jgi:hypothetical protein
MTVQLADGKWHNILGFRICDGGETLMGTAPVPQTGLYLEEVLAEGEAVLTWTF